MLRRIAQELGHLFNGKREVRLSRHDEKLGAAGDLGSNALGSSLWGQSEGVAGERHG